MKNNSATEMRRLLEHIKEYARNVKEAGCDANLSCYATIDLVQQKLSDLIVCNFKRWMHGDNKGHAVTIDYLTTYLQNKTELEKSLAVIPGKPFHSRSAATPCKPKTSVNQLRVESNNNIACYARSLNTSLLTVKRFKITILVKDLKQ